MEWPSCEQQFWTNDSFETHWENYHQPTEGALVAECFACPECGERRMNHLDWVEPYLEKIECRSCKLVSTP